MATPRPSPPWAQPDSRPYRSPEYEELRTQIERLADIVNRLEQLERQQLEEPVRREDPDC